MVRRGEGVGGVQRWGRREIIYLPLHCHHQNDSCIMTGSDESHFNVPVGSDGQRHRTMSTNHILFEEKGEPKRYRTEVLPLTSLTLYLLILSFIALHSPPAGVGCDQFFCLPSSFSFIFSPILSPFCPQRGTANAEFEVLSAQNTAVPIKPEVNQNINSLACFACSLEF